MKTEGKIQSIKAVAVVSKENPRLSLKFIFTHHDAMTTYVGPNERKIKVLITPVKQAVAAKKAPGSVKSKR